MDWHGRLATRHLRDRIGCCLLDIRAHYRPVSQMRLSSEAQLGRSICLVKGRPHVSVRNVHICVASWPVIYAVSHCCGS
jgi:hypothetical protein